MGSKGKRETSETVLVVDEGYYPVLMELLDHAKKSVDVLAFSFGIGSAAGKFTESGAPFKIARKLAELRKRGVSVRLYIEGFRETAERNRVTGEYLKKLGIKVKYGSTHAKGFCVDGRFVLFGSTNLTHQSVVKNNETNLLLSDAEAVEGFRKYFEHLWKGGEHGGVKLPLPMIADGGFKDALIEMIDSAKSRIDFSIYFFHVTEIEKAFIRAHERGVHVRGLIHDHASFGLSYVRRTHGTANRLGAAGIDDLHYGPGHLFTHSKYLIRDRREILLGTGNWLHEDIKVHPQLYVRLTDPRVARALATHLGKQITGKRRRAEVTL